jgi:hypothetical protein
LRKKLKEKIGHNGYHNIKTTRGSRRGGELKMSPHLIRKQETLPITKERDDRQQSSDERCCIYILTRAFSR